MAQLTGGGAFCSELKHHMKKKRKIPILRFPSQFTRVCKSPIRRLVLPQSKKTHANLQEPHNPISMYKRACVSNQMFFTFGLDDAKRGNS